MDMARWITGCGVIGALLLSAGVAGALQISDAYSPRNAERPLRQETRLIILHTTEGSLKGSLEKLRRNGEAHYLVGPDGHVYRIVHRDRVAWHAGRSMWEGTSNLDLVSIGIEIVGYHNQDITAAQSAAVRELLNQLKVLYRVPDERILPHSMVAYGAPNRWHRQSHRGRKRCGMQFARHDVRRSLGLTRQPRFDPDVRAGRLVEADPHLAGILFGSGREQTQAASQYAGDDPFLIARNRSAWDIARDAYNRPETVYIFPDGTRRTGSEITNWRAMPAGTRVVLGEALRDNAPEVIQVIGTHGESARDIAGEEAGRAQTIYFLTDGRVRQGHELDSGALAALEPGTRMLVGYTHGGYITARRSAFDVCGSKWNHESTFYRLSDGSLVSGDRMQEGAIPPRTMVFFPN